MKHTKLTTCECAHMAEVQLGGEERVLFDSERICFTSKYIKT